MKKLTNLVKTETLNVEELMMIKGAAAPSMGIGCDSHSCTGRSCDSFACTSNACRTSSCGGATCISSGCKTSMDTNAFANNNIQN